VTPPVWKQPKANMRDTFLAAALAITLAQSPVQAEIRTWTSANDPTKQFEGELVAASGEKITVLRADGSELTFLLGFVSGEDQAYVKEHAANLAPPVENLVYKELSSNTSRGTISSGAHYYILYAAASF